MTRRPPRPRGGAASDSASPEAGEAGGGAGARRDALKEARPGWREFRTRSGGRGRSLVFLLLVCPRRLGNRPRRSWLRQRRPRRSLGQTSRSALSVCSVMAAAAAVVAPSGLEDEVSRSRGEGAGEVVVERGPGAAYHMFVVMEDLVEKLKLLRYEEDLLRKNNLKPPSRWVPLSPERLDAGWALGRSLPPAFGGAPSAGYQALASVFLRSKEHFTPNLATEGRIAHGV